MSTNEVVEIEIQKLGVDICNIRQGSWDVDEEIVNSVRSRGIIQPLLVRPTYSHPDGKEFGIVCGSRRFHAALEAGLPRVPCVIKEMNDLEALSASMIENRQRSDTPTWLDIESVGKIYNTLQDKSHEEKINYIATLTGIASSTVEKYLDIFFLPEEIKGLLREPNERTKRQSETLLIYQSRSSDKKLPIGHAACLAEIKDIDLNKLMEIAVFVMDKKYEVVEQLIKYVKMYPDKTIDEIYDEMIKRVYGTYEKIIRFDSETWHAIEEACMDKQMTYDELIKKIIRERLEKEGYLETNEVIKVKLAEEEKGYVEV